MDDVTAAKCSNDGTISSIDSFVVGLAPTYWSHVPLLIEQMKTHLHLVNGTQCFVVQQHYCQHELQGDKLVSHLTPPLLSKAPKLIPLSKCLLVGTIVNAERKSSGCTMYVLDDGTGLIDVIHYADGELYALPSLSGLNDYSVGSNPCEPGDMVKIFGRIQCINAPMETNCRYFSANSRYFSANTITREIHASLIVPLVTASTSRSRARPNSIDQECEHWMNCVKFFRSINDRDGTSNLPLLNNALDVLSLLGSDLGNQMIDRNSVLPSTAADATNDAWRLFGTQCQCPDMSIKRDLLYCHCVATRLDTQRSDPSFRFRDAMLLTLLKAEAAFTSMLPPQKSVQNIWDDVINDVEIDQSSYHFQFQYSSVVADDELNQIANEEISKTSVDHDDGGVGTQSNRITFRNVQELIRGTVRALRKDGILYLVDANTDTYLLMSRTGVLEPYIRTRVALQKLSTECRSTGRYCEAFSTRFPYIESVPRSRLEYVRRGVIAATKCD